MSRLQKTVNNVRLGSYLTQLFFYRVTRIGGSLPVMILLIAFGALLFSDQGVQTDSNATLFGLCFVGWIACKIFYPKFEPGEPPRLYQAPPPPPPPPPRATAAAGRSDDPNEATVIGRLDPKLRDILRPKDSGKRS